MSDRKFYITTLTIRVLAEDEPWDGDLQWLSYDITEGHYVGDVPAQVVTEVTAEEMMEALAEAGSDSGFFDLPESEDDEDEE